MDEIIASGGGNIWATAGSIIVALVTGGLYARQRLSRDNTQIASDNSARDLLTFFSAELDKANTRTDAERNARILAEQRADTFAKERNDLVIQVGKLEGKIQSLESRLEALEGMRAQSRGTSHE